MKKAVFLDRDGVINDNSRPVNEVSQLHFIEGVLGALKELTDRGFALFVVTNQGGVGLGYMKRKTLDDIHHMMIEKIKAAGGDITEVKACIHRPKAGCSCRKPEAGMILDLALRYKIDLQKSYMVGDLYTDMQAGAKAGVKTIYIGTEDLRGRSLQPDYFARSLEEAVKKIQ